MRCTQHAVAAVIDDPALGLCVSAPEHEYQTVTVFNQNTDCRIREFLPAPALMRTGPGLLDRQYRIEQQHALIGPCRQIAGSRSWQAEVCRQFLKNVLQGRRWRNAGGNRKTQAMRLAGAVR